MPRVRPLSLGELSSLLPRLKATLVAAARAPRGRAASPRAGGRRRSRKRISTAESASLRRALLAILKRGKTGRPLGEIVKEAGAPRSAVAFQLRRLRLARQARVVGTRGLARWFPR